MEAIICVSEQEFNEIDLQVATWLRQTQGTQCDTWCKPTIHPVDGRYACYVDRERMLQSLTFSQQERIEVLTSDWFPVVPPPAV